jgi:hypothetical protein
MSYSVTKYNALVQEKEEKIVHFIASMKDLPCNLSSFIQDAQFVRDHGFFPELFLDSHGSTNIVSEDIGTSVTDTRKVTKKHTDSTKKIKKQNKTVARKLRISSMSALSLFKGAHVQATIPGTYSRFFICGHMQKKIIRLGPVYENGTMYYNMDILKNFTREQDEQKLKELFVISSMKIEGSNTTIEFTFVASHHYDFKNRFLGFCFEGETEQNELFTSQPFKVVNNPGAKTTRNINLSQIIKTITQ